MDSSPGGWSRELCNVDPPHVAPWRIGSEKQRRRSVQLPETYKALCRRRGEGALEGVVRLHSTDIEISGILGVSPWKSSIRDTEPLCAEWGLPKGLVLLQGDGHTWLALDYRESEVEPPVIQIDSETKGVLRVVSTFTDLLARIETE